MRNYRRPESEPDQFHFAITNSSRSTESEFKRRQEAINCWNSTDIFEERVDTLMGLLETPNDSFRMPSSEEEVDQAADQTAPFQNAPFQSMLLHSPLTAPTDQTSSTDQAREHGYSQHGNDSYYPSHMHSSNVDTSHESFLNMNSRGSSNSTSHFSNSALPPSGSVPPSIYNIHLRESPHHPPTKVSIMAEQQQLYEQQQFESEQRLRQQSSMPHFSSMLQPSILYTMMNANHDTLSSTSASALGLFDDFNRFANNSPSSAVSSSNISSPSTTISDHFSSMTPFSKTHEHSNQVTSSFSDTDTSETSTKKTSKKSKKRRRTDSSSKKETKKLKRDFKTRSDLGFLELVEGYFESPEEKVMGGKSNKTPASPHLIRLNLKNLPTDLLKQDPSYKLCGSLHGYHKLSKSVIRLSVLQEITLKESEKNVKRNRDDPDSILVTLDRMVVKHSSHNNGQKLFLRFTLHNQQDDILDHIDSAGFETITRRGVEKRRQKARLAPSQGDDTKPDLYQPTITSVEPEVISPYKNATFLKIVGKHFTGLSVNTVQVFLNDRPVKEVFAVRTDSIVCELDPMDPGDYTLKIQHNDRLLSTTCNVKCMDLTAETSTLRTSPHAIPVGSHAVQSHFGKRAHMNGFASHQTQPNFHNDVMSED